MDLFIDYRNTLEFAVCLIKLKEFAAAEEQIDEAERQGADAAMIRRHKALLYAATGHEEAALALMKDDTKSSRQIVTSTYALLGKKAQAIEGIRAALGSKGFRQNRWYRYSYQVLTNNPFFNNLRDDLEFKSILQEEKTRYEERSLKFVGL